MLTKCFFRVGDKRYFSCPGIIYNKRNSPYYFQQTSLIATDIKIDNEKEAQIWGDKYINMMRYLKREEGKYAIFTPSKKFISNDGLHLTRFGATYYAELVNFSDFITQ